MAKMTYKVAQGIILDALAKHGWEVKRNLKVPHATAPYDRVRLYFKSQSIYYDKGSPFSLNSARSLHLDPKDLAIFHSSEICDKLKEEVDYYANPTNVTRNPDRDKIRWKSHMKGGVAVSWSSNNIRAVIPGAQRALPKAGWPEARPANIPGQFWVGKTGNGSQVKLTFHWRQGSIALGTYATPLDGKKAAQKFADAAWPIAGSVERFMTSNPCALCVNPVELATADEAAEFALKRWGPLSWRGERDADITWKEFAKRIKSTGEPGSTETAAVVGKRSGKVRDFALRMNPKSKRKTKKKAKRKAKKKAKRKIKNPNKVSVRSLVARALK